MNITSINSRIREESIRQIKESLLVAADLGADPVVVHSGCLSSSRGDSEIYWQMLEEAFQIIDNTAETAGVRVGVEAMEKRKKELFVFPEEIK
ncbi:MAG: hypothetical protein DRP87_16085 [Spirochaetes bacterium]|nr:MAG: hypothetical protein DRP87_16085 [Spirochaetota bacterium]